MHALFEKTHPSIFSDWPLHTHRSHLFEPLQSVLVKKGVSIPETLPFSHWLHMFNNEEKRRLQFGRGMCCFSLRTHYVMVSLAPTRFLTSATVPDVAVSSVCLLNSWVPSQKGHHRDGWEASTLWHTDHQIILDVHWLLTSGFVDCINIHLSQKGFADRINWKL